MPTQPTKRLETFENPSPARDYTIDIAMPEFTCLCPKTGQPDFATLYLSYIPDRKCVELKSLKLYIWSFRNEGQFHEAVTNRILADLVAATEPRYMQLRAEFYVRGGVYTTVTAEHRKPGWQNPPPPPAAITEAGQRPAPTPTRAGDARFRMLARNAAPAAKPAAEGPEPEPEPEPAPARPQIALGIDLGTSGCRVIAIDNAHTILAHAEAPIAITPARNGEITQDPGLWWKAVGDCLTAVLQQVDPAAVGAIAVDGTSATLLLTDARGQPLTPALMYHDHRATAEALRLAELAPARSGAQGATSSLAKLLWLAGQGMDRKAAHALHQSDWIAGMLTGQWGHSDYNNCLKLGFDIEALAWPQWMERLGLRLALLPKVHAPGATIAPVSQEVARRFGLARDTVVVAGTTDGVASFLAAGATETGHAVTALGSTLVLKLLSETPVFAPEHGVYSHRLGNRWLVGGASNTGGAVLLQYFKLDQIREMSAQLRPDKLTGLSYYPLPGVGERFPVNDPNMNPVLQPLPGDSITFFQGILEGIASIEAEGYGLLHNLGAPAVREIRTTGGGSTNEPWRRMRENIIGVPIRPAHSQHAAFGAALLAAQHGRTP